MARYEYKPLTAQEFARNLDDMDITLGQFCRITGFDYNEVRDEWLQRQTKPIPHIVRVFFAMTVLPGGSAIARQITDAVIERSNDFNESEKRRHGSGYEARESVQVEHKVNRLKKTQSSRD